MKNVLFILLLVLIAFYLGFLLENKITGEVIIDDAISIDTCLYQTRTGINVLPNKEICCDTMRRFFKCQRLTETEIFYGTHSAFVNMQCYNNHEGELKLFFSDDLNKFCEKEDYI